MKLHFALLLASSVLCTAPPGGDSQQPRKSNTTTSTLQAPQPKPDAELLVAQFLTRFNKLFTPISTVDKTTPFPVITMDPFTYATPSAEKRCDLMWALSQANSVSIDFAKASSDAPYLLFDMGLCIRSVDNNGMQCVSTWRFESHYGALKKEMFTQEVLKTVSSQFKHDFDKDKTLSMTHPFPQAKLIREILRRNIPVILHDGKKTLDHIGKYADMPSLSINSFKFVYDTMYLLKEFGDLSAVKLEVLSDKFMRRTRNLPQWEDTRVEVVQLGNVEMADGIIYPTTCRTLNMTTTADVRALAIQLVYVEMIDRINKLKKDVEICERKFYKPDPLVVKKHPNNNFSNSSSSSNSGTTKLAALNVVQITLNATSADSPALKPNSLSSDVAKFEKYFTSIADILNKPVVYNLNKSSHALKYEDLLWALSQANCVAMSLEVTGIQGTYTTYNSDLFISDVKKHNVFQMGLSIVAFKDGKEYISTWRINAGADGVLKESMFNADSLRVLKKKLGEAFVQEIGSTMLDSTVLRSILDSVQKRKVPVIFYDSSMDLLHVAKIMGRDIKKVGHGLMTVFDVVFDIDSLGLKVDILSSEKSRKDLAVGRVDSLKALVNKLYPMISNWNFNDTACAALGTYLTYRTIIERLVELGGEPLGSNDDFFNLRF